jgi:hypothetical protein
MITAANREIADNTVSTRGKREKAERRPIVIPMCPNTRHESNR